ncbi:hypothetical protein ACO0LB_14995 [Undibacterium sp. SXout7W]|uniref:hypothetical protein n=1 Tax=Undibacterium sp. SXout7W TaxID=3413049 RepID=UPI003BF36D39
MKILPADLLPDPGLLWLQCRSWHSKCMPLAMASRAAAQQYSGWLHHFYREQHDGNGRD